MRGLFRAASLALVFYGVAPASASAQTPPKIAFINSAAILAQAPGRAEAEAKFKSEVTAYQGQLQRMSDSLQTMAAAFDKEAPRLDSVTRETRAQNIRAKETDYQNRARKLDEQMQSRQAELVRPIMEQVQKIIEQIRTEENYSMIFDVGSQASVVVAADKSLDITSKVLTRLKTAKPASNPNPLAPKPAGVSRRPTP
jgi:outer membrane protein